LFVLLPRSPDGRVAPEAWPRRFAPGGGARARQRAKNFGALGGMRGRWVGGWGGGRARAAREKFWATGVPC
jgi:hypothetical protein